MRRPRATIQRLCWFLLLCSALALLLHWWTLHNDKPERLAYVPRYNRLVTIRNGRAVLMKIEDQTGQQAIRVMPVAGKDVEEIARETVNGAQIGGITVHEEDVFYTVGISASVRF